MTIDRSFTCAVNGTDPQIHVRRGCESCGGTGLLCSIRESSASDSQNWLDNQQA